MIEGRCIIFNKHLNVILHFLNFVHMSNSFSIFNTARRTYILKIAKAFMIYTLASTIAFYRSIASKFILIR